MIDSPLDILVASRTSDPDAKISSEDINLYADPGPSDTNGQSPPREEIDVGITGDEIQQITMDILAGRPVRPSSPYAERVAERLKAEIAALPVGAIVEFPPDVP